MKTHVTVVPSDSFLSVDGINIVFPFTAPANIHAIQWHNGSGHIEFTDGTPNGQLAAADYETEVAPYVVLWEEEKYRLERAVGSPPTLAEAKARKLAEVMGAYDAAFAPINAIYPAKEREGWAVQEAEAKAVLADPATETPVLSILVSIRNKGETVRELAAKVLENAATWRTVYAYLTGQQQAMYAQVTALATVEAVQAYPVQYAMPEGF